MIAVPTFSYTARDRDGRVLTGQQDSASEAEALRLLQSQGLLVTKIRETGGAVSSQGRRRRFHTGVRSQDLLLFIRQFATLSNAGIPLLRALTVIANQTESRRLTAVLERMRQDIQAGTTLKGAMAKHPRVFPSMWPLLVEAGEVSSKLPFVLTQLARHLEETEKIKRKVLTALVYPALLCVVATVAITVFMVWLIPVFARLYATFDAQLPLLTRIVMSASELIRKFLASIVVGSVGGAYVLVRYVSTPSGHAVLSRVLLRVPIFGAFFRDAILARMTRNLYVLIQSGISLLQTLDVAGRASGNGEFEQALETVRMDVQQGKSLGAALGKHEGLFTSMMVQMVTVGEESGRLEELLGRVAEYYEERVDAFVSRLSLLIEPVILVVVGSVVGVLVVAMFLPVLRMSTLVR